MTRASLVFLFVLSAAAQAEKSSGVALVEFGGDFDVKAVQCRGAKVSLVAGGRLRLEVVGGGRTASAAFKAPSGRWDLTRYQYVETDVWNVGSGGASVGLRVEAPRADGKPGGSIARADLAPGGRTTVAVRLAETPWRFDRPLELIGMRGAPGRQSPLDASAVSHLAVFVSGARAGQVFEFGGLRAAGAVEILKADKFPPFIDEFGQFIHRDWPSKTHSAEEFAKRRTAEEADLAAHAAPADWNEYGGWSAGPQLKATGFFRAEKRDGRWWLVDPSGRLFWSNGIDCARASNPTPLTDRKNYFRNLPEPASPAGAFFGRGRGWGTVHDYYRGRSYETYDFFAANLFRKYGRQWQDAHVAITHRRLRSWGLNTLGNWSGEEYQLARRTPYVASVTMSGADIEASEGFWRKFPDVFDPFTRRALAERLRKEAPIFASDPWCVGCFVDNELSWGDDLYLAGAVLASPAEQAAKKVFVADLRAKYGAVEKLNEAWGEKHASWDALLAHAKAPDEKRAAADLGAFAVKQAEAYFRLCREEVKRVAPNTMYLGCRFAWKNDQAVRAAAKYCDVVSFNWYREDAADFRLPEGVDMPAIIGEFHFGALDRGMFHTGLRGAADQDERGEKYRRYVESALKNPSLVGVHWFQYCDQPATGRADGENYQIGFIDVCDTPYPETVAACRKVAAGMYALRAGGR